MDPTTPTDDPVALPASPDPGTPPVSDEPSVPPTPDQAPEGATNPVEGAPVSDQPPADTNQNL